MKRLMRHARGACLAGLVLACGAVRAATTEALGLVKAEEGMILEPGKYYTNFAVCKKYADDNGMPLLVIYSKTNCGNCNSLKDTLVSDDFKSRLASIDEGQVIICLIARGEYDAKGQLHPDQPSEIIPGLKIEGNGADVSAADWVKEGGSNHTTMTTFPFVAFWWKEGGVDLRYDAYTPTPAGLQYHLQTYFKGWTGVGSASIPVPMQVGATAGHRIEMEPGKTLTLALGRTFANGGKMTGQVTVTRPNGTTFQSNVTWPAGKKHVDWTLTPEQAGLTKAGDTATVSFEVDRETFSAKVTFVTDTGARAGNPLWLGERTTETLAWGEWTMDLDAATNKTAKASGEAFTLVSVMGTQWDAAAQAFDAHVLASGTVGFRTWAQKHQVALVACDVPCVDGLASWRDASLLTRQPFRANGVPARSGLGYAARKGFTQRTGQDLWKATFTRLRTPFADGGWATADEAVAETVAAPRFLLLRKDGSVAARIPCFQAGEPVTAADAAVALKRFDEALERARTGAHADLLAGEEARLDAPALAHGTAVRGELSAGDRVDFLRLATVDGAARVAVTVTGSAATPVTVSLVQQREFGLETIATATGDWAKGVTVAGDFTETGACFVCVEGAADAAVFARTAAGTTWRAYTATAQVARLPQAAATTVTLPAGTAIVELMTGRLYDLKGLHATANASVLEKVSVDAATGLTRYRAKTTGATSLRLASTTFTYAAPKTGTQVTLAASARTPQAVTLAVDVTALDTDGAVLAFEATNPKTGKTVELKHLTCDGAAFANGTTTLAFGKHTIVWNAAADWGLTAVPTGLKISARIVGTPAPYLVVNLPKNGAAGASTFTTRDAEPAGGWSTQEKTTQLVLRRIAPGGFTMGSPASEIGRKDVEDPHRVRITKPFYIGVFEVTQAQWERVMGSNPSSSGRGETNPADNMTYENIRGSTLEYVWPESAEVDPDSFVGRLGAGTAAAFDLPTEAQWEYACRAGTTTAFNNGKDITLADICPNLYDVAVYWGHGGTVQPVGSRLPNAWGLYDMHGNVEEWCRDRYTEHLGTADVTDPVGSETAEYYVRRGGYASYDAHSCRAAARISGAAFDRTQSAGLRVIATFADERVLMPIVVATVTRDTTPEPKPEPTIEPTPEPTPEPGPTRDTTRTLTSGRIPYAWLEAAGLVKAGAPEADYEKAAAAKAPGARRSAAEAYLLGLDARDASDTVFQAKIAFKDGRPVVSWAPDVPARCTYVVEGAAALGAQATWRKVADPEKPDATLRFFRVRAVAK